MVLFHSHITFGTTGGPHAETRAITLELYEPCFVLRHNCIQSAPQPFIATLKWRKWLVNKQGQNLGPVCLPARV